MTTALPISSFPAAVSLASTDVTVFTQGSTGPGTGTTRKVSIGQLEALFNAVTILSFGAVADAQKSACTVTNSLSGTAITFAESLFASTDVGKAISITINTAAGTNLPQGTTITQVISATQIVVSAGAVAAAAGVAAWVVWGTDNSAAFASAMATGSVIIPAGSFAYTVGAFMPTTGCTVRGSGANSVIFPINSKGTVGPTPTYPDGSLFWNPRMAVFSGTGPTTPYAAGAQPDGNYLYQDFAFDMTGMNSAGGSSAFLHFQAKNITFTRVRWYASGNFQFGQNKFANCDNIRVEDCYAAIPPVSVGVWDACTRIKILNNTFNGSVSGSTVNSGGININASGWRGIGGVTSDVLVQGNSINIAGGVGVAFFPFWPLTNTNPAFNGTEGGGSISNFRATGNQITYATQQTGFLSPAFIVVGDVSNGVIEGNTITNCGLALQSGADAKSYTSPTVSITFTPSVGTSVCVVNVPGSSDTLAPNLLMYLQTAVTVGGVVLAQFSAYVPTAVSGDNITITIPGVAADSTPVAFVGTLQLVHGITHAVQFNNNIINSPSPTSPNAVILLNGRGVMASNNTIIGTGTNWGCLVSNNGFYPYNQSYGDVAPAVMVGNYGPTGTAALGPQMTNGSGRYQWQSFYGTPIIVDTNTTSTALQNWSGSISAPPRIVTAAGAVTVAQPDYVVVINKTVGAATAVSLPTSGNPGRTYLVKDGKGDAATNNITITPIGKNIDGAATLVISTNYGSATLIDNGTQWNVV